MIINTRSPSFPLATRNQATAHGAAAAGYTPESNAAREAPGNGTKSPAGPANGTESERLLKELHDYIDKGPIVALREKMLKSMNLTEDKIKAMSPEQQSAVEDEVSRRIKDFLLEQKELKHAQPALQAKLRAYRNASAAPV